MQKPKSWYNSAYQIEKSYRRKPEQSIYYAIWDYAIERIANERIIDFGCGTGQFARLLIKRNKNFVQGIDFSTQAIAIAKQKNKKYSHQFVAKNLLQIKSLPNYDLVICFEVLEHITHDLKIIQKIDSGKRFMFSVPNYLSTSHVRKFRFKSDIHKRYGNLLNINHIEIFRFECGNKIFLIDSVKK